MSEKLNVLQRINEVRRKNDYIKKDKKVSGGEGYMAVTHDMVTAALRNDLVEHGVIIAPELVEHHTVDTGNKTAKGTVIIRFEGVFDVHFISVDDAKDRLTIRLPAHANDQGDKAPGKAVSYAVKYAMLKVFSIETGEDDEGRFDEGTVGMPTKEREEWEGKIDALKESGKAGEDLWEAMKKACLAHGEDMKTLTLLKARLTAKLTALKKNGAKKGGSDAHAPN